LRSVVHTFLLTFFRLLYNEFAWTYDFVAWVVSIGHWKTWVLSVLSDIECSPVLELGFGPGHLQESLFNSGFCTFGLDASKFMLGLAFNRIRKLGFVPLMVNGYAQNMPFKNGFFQTIVATFPSEYIFREDTWKEIHRVLDINGKVVLLPAAWLTGKNVLQRLAALLFRITHQVPSASPTPAKPPQAVELIESYGFNVSYEYRELTDSTVLILCATKSGTS
jgi:ubiquinone/menaquinone biosynthesis C-methylase UbiE